MARPCNPLRLCINTVGSYLCGPCPPGYANNSRTECLLTDPCAAKQHNCEKDSYCINTAVGAFRCQVTNIRPFRDYLLTGSSPFSLVHTTSVQWGCMAMVSTAYHMVTLMESQEFHCLTTSVLMMMM